MLLICTEFNLGNLIGRSFLPLWPEDIDRAICALTSPIRSPPTKLAIPCIPKSTGSLSVWRVVLRWSNSTTRDRDNTQDIFLNLWISRISWPATPALMAYRRLKQKSRKREATKRRGGYTNKRQERQIQRFLLTQKWKPAEMVSYISPVCSESCRILIIVKTDLEYMVEISKQIIWQ